MPAARGRTLTVVERVEPPYRDASRARDERVEDLLLRMTLAEKAAQLGSAWVFQVAKGIEVSESGAELLRNGLGQVTRISGASSLDAEGAARLANAIQRHLVEETRLGIPAIVHEEICSGLMGREAVVFPQAIGLASTWDPDLAEQLADAIRVQMRAVGAHQGLAPVLDVCRDPRWGRTEETFGEDPYLVSRVGVAFTRGLQGPSLRSGVVATLKHFVGYGASDGGMNWAPAGIPPRALREVYLHPFEAAVRVAGARSVMNAYNEIDGILCAADRDLLTRTLRDEWGFEGFVVSDYFSIRQLADYHRLAVDGESAAVLALEAGLDVELPATDCYGAPLLGAIEAGTVAEGTLDEAVRRVLRTKFDLGLFDEPYVDVAAVSGAAATAAHRELARTIARKSIVLLSNDGVLPLAAEVGSIAVIGPNADTARNLFGDYAYPAHVESLQNVLDSGRSSLSTPGVESVQIAPMEIEAPSVLDALRARYGSRVSFAPGCDVAGSSDAGFGEAAELAADADVVVMVMGDKSGLTEDCTSGEFRDRASFDLPGVQEELVRAVLATGTPVVLVLVAGRPSASAWLHEHCAAVVMAWLPGEEGAGAIADVLSGDTNPGGKLPLSYPRAVGQVPVFYAHKASGGRSHPVGDYVDQSASALYPFGHGLSYTTFELSELRIAEETVRWADELVVEARVTNTGKQVGDEVVQLYTRDPQASVTRPERELKSFLRLTLEPGETRRITFRVPVAQLGFYDRDLTYVVESGAIEVFLGRSSADTVSVGSVTVVPADQQPVKAFHGSVAVD
jgi:beta-glucosidase